MMGSVKPTLLLSLLSLSLITAIPTTTPAPTHVTPAEIDPHTSVIEPTDDSIFTEYFKRADQLYVQALTDYYTAHPDRLESELSSLTSPEYESIPSTLLDSFHIDRGAIEAKIHENDQRFMNEMEEEMQQEDAADDDAHTDINDADAQVDEEDPASDSADHEISQRGGGGVGIRRGRGRGRRFGMTWWPYWPRSRRCMYWRGRFRCMFVMSPPIMDDLDDGMEPEPLPIIIMPLWRRRLWYRTHPLLGMRGRGLGRGIGLGLGLGLGATRGSGLLGSRGGPGGAGGRGGGGDDGGAGEPGEGGGDRGGRGGAGGGTGGGGGGGGGGMGGGAGGRGGGFGFGDF